MNLKTNQNRFLSFNSFYIWHLSLTFKFESWWGVSNGKRRHWFNYCVVYFVARFLQATPTRYSVAHSITKATLSSQVTWRAALLRCVCMSLRCPLIAQIIFIKEMNKWKHARAACFCLQDRKTTRAGYGSAKLFKLSGFLKMYVRRTLTTCGHIYYIYPRASL